MAFQGTLTSPSGREYDVEFDGEPTDEDINAVIADISQKEQDTLQPKSEAITNAIGHGVASIVPSVIKGVASVGDLIDDGSTGIKAAEELQSGVDAAFPVNPKYQDSFGVKAAGAVGQGAGFAGTALASGGAAIPLTIAGLSGAGQGSDLADQLGLEGIRRAGVVLGYGAAEAGVESIGGIGAVKRFTPSFLKESGRAIPDAIRAIGGEAAEEPITGFLQDITRDLAVAGTDKPGANPFNLKNRGEELLYGAIGAAPFGAMNLMGRTGSTAAEAPKVTVTAEVDGQQVELPPGITEEGLKAMGVNPDTVVTSVVLPPEERAAVESAPTEGSKAAVESVLAGVATTPSAFDEPITPEEENALAGVADVNVPEEVVPPETPTQEPIQTNEPQQEIQGQGIEGQQGQGVLTPTEEPVVEQPPTTVADLASSTVTASKNIDLQAFKERAKAGVQNIAPSIAPETITPTSEGSAPGGGNDLGTSTEGEATGSTAPRVSLEEGRTKEQIVNENIFRQVLGLPLLDVEDGTSISSPESRSVFTRPENPIGPTQAKSYVRSTHGLGPSQVVIIDKPGLEVRGFMHGGKIYLNAPWIRDARELDEVLYHEVVHRVENDGSMRADVQAVMKAVPPKTLQAMDDYLTRAGYELNQFPNERAAITLSELANKFRALPTFQRLVAKIKAWFKQQVGMSLSQRDAEAIASRVVAKGIKQLKSGQPMREDRGNGNVRRSTPEVPPTTPPPFTPGSGRAPVRSQTFGRTEAGSPIATPARYSDVKRIITGSFFDPSGTLTPARTAEANSLALDLTDPVKGKAFARRLVDAVDPADANIAVGVFHEQLMRYAMRLMKEESNPTLYNYLMGNMPRFVINDAGQTFRDIGQILFGRSQYSLSAFMTAVKEVSTDMEGAKAKYIPKETLDDITDGVNETKLSSDEVKKVKDKTIGKTGKTIAEVAKAAGEKTDAEKALESLYKRLEEGPKKFKAVNKIKELVDKYIASKPGERLDYAQMTAEFEKLGFDEKSVIDIFIDNANKVIRNKELSKEQRQKNREAELAARVEKEVEVEKDNSATKTAKSILGELAALQSDTQSWPESKVNEVRQAVRAALTSNYNDETLTTALVNKLNSLGVNPSVSDVLTKSVIKQRANNTIVNAELKARLLAEGKRGSLKTLEQQLIDATPAQQQDPRWRRALILDYFSQLGLTDAQAKTAARIYDREFTERLAEALDNVVERQVKKSAPWNKKKSDVMEAVKRKMNSNLLKVREAIRTGLIDPRNSWHEELAKENGWTGFTIKQFQRMQQIDDALSDPELLDHDKAKLLHELENIIADAKVPDNIGNLILAHYTSSVLGGLSTIFVQGSAHVGLLRDFFGDVLVNPKTAVLALKDGLSNIVNETRYALKNDVYKNEVGEHMKGHEKPLQRLLQKGLDEFDSTNPARKAMGLFKIIVGAQSYSMRLLSSIDQGYISTAQMYRTTLFSKRALGKLGLTEQQAGYIIEEALRAKGEFYYAGIERGLSHIEASARANDLFLRRLYEDVARQPGEPGGPNGVEMAEDIKLGALRDAEGAVGRLSPDVDPLWGEGTLSQVINAPLYGISRMLNRGGLTGLQARSVFGFVTIPFRTAKWYAGYSPWGFVRYGIHKGATKLGKESPYQQSFATQAQVRQRLQDATFGTALMALVAALAANSGDDDSEKEEYKIFVTGFGPEDKGLRDVWNKKFKPFSLIIKTGKAYTPLNLGRLYESLAWPLALAGAMDDTALKRQGSAARSPGKTFPEMSELFGSYFGSLSQRSSFQGLNKMADLSKGYGSGQIHVDAANMGAFAASGMVPWKGMISSVQRMLTGPVERNSIEGAIYANTPVLGPLLGKPALNILGDPIGDQSVSGKLYGVGFPLPVRFSTSIQGKKAYDIILEKGRGPSVARRNDIEKIYGTITDDQFYRFGKLRGEKIKESLVRDYDKIKKMDQEKYGKYLEGLSRKENPSTAKAIGLTKK